MIKSYLDSFNARSACCHSIIQYIIDRADAVIISKQSNKTRLELVVSYFIGSMWQFLIKENVSNMFHCYPNHFSVITIAVSHQRFDDLRISIQGIEVPLSRPIYFRHITV